jgi:predicted ATP-dependent endonuclease of OLD family
MKLRYLKARNILSFGDEEVRLDFGTFNIIAGPNDAGKTNLFRALDLIEKAFGYRTLTLQDIFFRGYNDKRLNLEVGVELDETEQELLSTVLICSEIRETQRQNRPEIINKDKPWKSVFINYGTPILSKSLKFMSFVLRKDELRISEPKLEIQFAEEENIFYVNRSSHLSGMSREPMGGYQQIYLAKEIVEAFYKKFGDLPESEINMLLEDNKRLFDESPSLFTLLKGKLGGLSNRVVNFEGGSFRDFSNIQEMETILNRLFVLCEQKGINEDRLYFWEILMELYKKSFIRLSELRFLSSNQTHSDANKDSKPSSIVGSALAMRLFQLMIKGTRKERAKYDRIHAEFNNLTDSEFEVAVREKEIEVSSEKDLGVMTPARNSFDFSSNPEFSPLGYKSEVKKRLISEAFIQIIKDKYPVAMEQTASGIHEILLLLTAIIGESDKVLLLDEPELHLHPTMQKRILNLLICESKAKDHNQIMLITHSPYLTYTDNMDTIWRLTKTEEGTKVHNLGEVLSSFEDEEKQKIAIKLASPDLRSILFSRGVILVEGPSDKIVVEQIDRYLSTKKKGAEIDENEWPIVDISGKKNLALYMRLSQTFDVPSLAILDLDALMHIEHKIKSNGWEARTSTIPFALWYTKKLNLLTAKDLFSEAPDGDWYENSYAKTLMNISNKNGIYVFSNDLEGVMQSPTTSKESKPLKAVERILELIGNDSLPPEFFKMCDFLKERTKALQFSNKD